ncbi:hypothetical protein JNW88_19250 [Micromonospora sp. ATA32]|nr:hypothetical protein [Micromonospora sp. ATA32]
MRAVTGVNVQQYWEKGYTIVRGVYSQEEIAEFRRGALAGQGKHPGDLLSHPELRSVVTDGRMLDVARQILDRDDIVYYADSAAAIREGVPSFHKDNADRDDPDGPDWGSPYTQIRFGIYLQDHYRHSGGLNVREGSHNKVNTTEGRVRQLCTRAGDLGVWSMRTSHSASGAILRWPFHNVHPHYSQVKRLPSWLIAPKDGQRIALFVGLGADDAHLERYIDYLKSRAYVISNWKRTAWSEEAIREAEASGLRLRNVPAEIVGVEGLGQNVQHQPIPY